ncbi:MAG: mercuric reductase [Thermodesulfobacteriota bacterium]|nr:MAG: mercuric reductase [Thermodesulfobacteriota bacterium]
MDKHGDKFDLVIIGGGVGGLVAASGAAQLGARVALVEKNDSLGGDCLHWGCVPTKRLVYAAKVASIVRNAKEFGIETGPVKVDFPAVMEKMRAVQAKIGEHDDPERFRKMGIEVIFGGGSFKDKFTFEAGGRLLKGRKFLIATGSGPVIIPIPGLKESGVLTNETALRLKKLPAELVILGAGPIGIEFAQVFSRLGSKVTIVEKMGQILPREDKEISDTLQLILEKEGIKIDTCTEVTDVKVKGSKKCISAACETGKKSYNPDEVMIAIGRAPNVEGLNLEAAGVEYDKRRGIKADRTLRTSQKHIYACGDVIGHYAFTHVAEYQAGIIVSNALFPFVSRKTDYSSVPWVTYSDPELARVGLTENEAREKHGSSVKVYRFYFKDVDRAVIEGEGQGLIKLMVDKKNRILGAHILGPHAGEMLHEYVLAKQAGLPITSISKTIHVYPTLAQGVKRAADQYYAEKLFKGWFPKFARWIIRRGG